MANKTTILVPFDLNLQPSLRRAPRTNGGKPIRWALVVSLKPKQEQHQLLLLLLQERNKRQSTTEQPRR
jgi:hypothetical protein